jgi:hypothetical protein
MQPGAQWESLGTLPICPCECPAFHHRTTLPPMAYPISPGRLRLFTCAHLQFISSLRRMSDRRCRAVSAHCFFPGARWIATMGADEYVRLQAACVAMARQSRTLEVRLRWVKLAGGIRSCARGVSNGPQSWRRSRARTENPCSYPSALSKSKPNSAAAPDNIPLTTKSPVERQLAGPSLIVTPRGDSSSR